jgi:hypothetical protein
VSLTFDQFQDFCIPALGAGRFVGLFGAVVSRLSCVSTVGCASSVANSLSGVERKPSTSPDASGGLSKVDNAKEVSSMECLELLPQHFLYFLPLPQVHGSFRPVLGMGGLYKTELRQF